MRRRAFVRRMAFAALACGFLRAPLPRLSREWAGYAHTQAMHGGFGRLSVPVPPGGGVLSVVWRHDRDTTHTEYEYVGPGRFLEIPVWGPVEAEWEWR